MESMTAVERIGRILRRQSVDRVGIYEHFWGDTHGDWVQKGHIKKDENLTVHFQLDMEECWPFKLTADLQFQKQVVAETEDTVTYLDGNGATLRWKKHSNGTPEHVAFRVSERAQWEEIKPLLTPIEERIDLFSYYMTRERCKEENRFFLWSGVNVFESIHPLCGHENLLIGMALDPDWIRDMAETYADLMIQLMEILFSKAGKPDGIWFYEDMGYKGAPFMSPQMYRELIFPSHKKTIDFLHGQGLPVIMHSCGFVEPLLPDMVEAGIDALQAMEIKAGMDPLRIQKQYGEKIALMGGMDIRELCANDKKRVNIELEKKLPALKNGFGYILHSDHSVPKTVEYETYRYFLEKGIQLGSYGL